MTDIYITLASLGVVVTMSGLAWVLGFHTPARLADEAALTAALADYEPGAAIRDCALDARGRAALARLADGRLLVARALGDRLSLRVFPERAAQVKLRPGRALLSFADLGYPQLSLRLAADAPPQWLADLANARAPGGAS